MFSPKTSAENKSAPTKFYVSYDDLDANTTTSNRTATGDFSKVSELISNASSTSNSSFAQAYDNLYQQNVVGVLYQLTSQNNFNENKDTHIKLTFKDSNNNWYTVNSFAPSSQGRDNEYSESEAGIARINAVNIKWASIIDTQVLIKNELVKGQQYLTVELLK